jgi:conjugal transfer pilus assembly protein TraD
MFASPLLVFALGTIAGLVLATVLPRHGWRWTWTVPGLALSWLLGPIVPGPAAAASWTLAVAALAGWRRRRRHLLYGADLAAAAAAQIGPLGALGRSLSRRRLTRGAWSGARGMVVGADIRGRAVHIPLAPGSAMHTLVLGATGSGKTVTQTWITVRAIQQGQAAIVIDPKGDEQLRGALARAAHQNGRTFLEWTPEGPCTYNPYAHGSATEVADRALSAERFTEPHYLRQAQRYLGHAVRAMRAAEMTVSPATLVAHLEPIQLEILARKLPESDARPLWGYLDSLTVRQERDLAGTRDRLAILCESELGPLLEPVEAPRRCIDLDQALAWQAVVYFRLDADRRPLAAAMLAGAIVGDLIAIAAARQGDAAPAVVAIDEFSALAADQVSRLFARGRSAGISLVLATQELSDLRAAGREELLDQVLGNLGALIAHRQVLPASAELVASVAGTRPVWSVTEHTRSPPAPLAGRYSRTRARVREYVIHPDTVSSLPCGAAAVMVPAGDQAPVIARMLRASS